MQDNKTLYLKLIFSQLFWSGVFIAGQLALVNQSPLMVALIRNVLTSLLFLGILLFLNTKKNIPPRESYFSLMLMGFFGVFLYNILVYSGLKYTTAVSASLLIPTIQPIATVVLSTLINKEVFTRNQYFGLLLGLIGAAAVLTGKWSLKVSSVDMLGNLLILAAAITFSAYSVCGKIALKYVTPLEATTYSTVIGTIFLFPVSLIGKGIFSLQNANLEFWLCISYLVVFASVLPYLWWYSAVKKIGASKTSIITFLMPPFALILAFLILHQVPSLLQILGGISGLCGVAFASGLIKYHQKSD